MFLASTEYRKDSLVKIAEYCAKNKCSTCILNEYFRSCNFEEMHKECLEIAMELIEEERYEDTYKAWVLMDCERVVISKEYDSINELYHEISQIYTIDELIENGFTFNLLLCDDNYPWFECLEEVKPHKDMFE